MKFWKGLAWACTVGFLLLIFVSWLVHDRPAAPTPEQLNEPPLAPKFR